MSTPAQKKRKKAAKVALPALPASSTSAPLAATAPATTRAAPLSAIAARRAAAALIAAASRPPTPPSAPIEEPELERDLQEDEDRRARALIADAAVDDDDDSRGGLAADHIVSGEEDESSDAYGSSEGEGEDITLQMDGEVISLGSVPRPSRPTSRRKAKPTKGKGREGRISQLDVLDGSETLGESRARNQSMEVDTPQRSAYGASNSGTPSVADSRVPKKRKGYQSSSSYQGAMSAFLPTLGQNVLRLDADRLKDVFSDVQDGETACVVLLKADETVVFSGSCALYPLLSSVSVFGAVLPPTTTSPPTIHTIYAPISHPLPVVTPAHGSSAPSPYVSLLGLDPETLSGYACVFLVRERRSGLECMCRAVGGLFDGVWEGETAGWGVRGFFPILSQTSFTAYTMPPTWQSALAAAIPLPAEEPSAPTAGSTYEIVPDSPSSSTASLPSPSSEAEDDSYGPFTALLKGPKRSGKSGMSRALVNRLLGKYKKVAYLETDLGQSEFGPEGVVSLVILEQPLLGPSFTHPAIPFRAHYFGSSTPRNDPSRYLALVNDLLSAYRLSVQYPPYASTYGASQVASTSTDIRNAAVVPLVINTQGWFKGLGMDLLVRIEQEAEVTDVFEFEAASGGPGDEWEDGGWEASIPLEGGWGRIWAENDGAMDDPYRQSSRAGPRRHFLSPVGGTPLAARWTASDLRLLSLITYFHAQFPAPTTADSMAADASPLAESWHFDLPLVAHRPWAVDWTKAFSAIYLAGAGAEDIVPSLIWDALSISLVALVAPDDDSPVAGRPTDFRSAVPYEQGRPPPDPASSRCLGLAIVRATPGLAPPHDQTVHLVTPCPARLLSQATLLVKGETELPLAAMLDWRVDADFIGGVGGVERENVPFIEWVGKDGGVGVIGGGRRKVRRNVGRRQG